MVTLTCHCLDSRQVKCDREQVERPLANTFQNREYPSTEVEYKKDKFFFFSPSSFRGCNRHMEVRKSVKIPSKTLPPARLYPPSFFFQSERNNRGDGKNTKSLSTRSVTNL